MSGRPLMKHGYFDCAGILAWCRRQSCMECMECKAAPPVDPSHFPSRGSGGHDLGCAPLCRRCHDRAQRYEAPFTAEYQERLSLRALRSFIETANEWEWASFVMSRERFVAARIFMEAF